MDNDYLRDLIEAVQNLTAEIRKLGLNDADTKTGGLELIAKEINERGEEYICLACKVSGQVDDADHLYQLVQRGRCPCSNYKKSELKKKWIKR